MSSSRRCGCWRSGGRRCPGRAGHPVSWAGRRSSPRHREFVWPRCLVKRRRWGTESPSQWRGRWVTRNGANRGREELFGDADGSDLEAVEIEGAVIELVTRCSSVDEFIVRFARFATETAIVVPSLPHVIVGDRKSTRL